MKTEKNIESNSQQDLDLSFSARDDNYTPSPKEYLVTDKDILRFAKQILLFVFLSFILCLAFGVFFKIQVLFEIIKMGILPLVALIIGYYFGANK